MCSFDGAEICELVGLYLLDHLSNILPVESFGLYRDDGLAILSSDSGPDTERIIKNIRNLFKTNNLKIIIEAGMQQTDFLVRQILALQETKLTTAIYSHPV